MFEEDTASDEYEIGFGKPPKATRFRSGQSGNPSGRPKYRSSFETLLEKGLNQKTKIKISGEVRSVTVKEAAVTRLVQIMLQGPPDKVISVLKFALPLLPPEAQEPASYDLRKLDDDEVDQLEYLATKMSTQSQ